MKNIEQIIEFINKEYYLASYAKKRKDIDSETHTYLQACEDQCVAILNFIQREVK